MQISPFWALAGDRVIRGCCARSGEHAALREPAVRPAWLWGDLGRAPVSSGLLPTTSVLSPMPTGLLPASQTGVTDAASCEPGGPGARHSPEEPGIWATRGVISPQAAASGGWCWPAAAGTGCSGWVPDRRAGRRSGDHAGQPFPPPCRQELRARPLCHHAASTRRSERKHGQPPAVPRGKAARLPVPYIPSSVCHAAPGATPPAPSPQRGHTDTVIGPTDTARAEEPDIWEEQALEGRGRPDLGEGKHVLVDGLTCMVYTLPPPAGTGWSCVGLGAAAGRCSPRPVCGSLELVRPSSGGHRRWR